MRRREGRTARLLRALKYLLSARRALARQEIEPRGALIPVHHRRASIASRPQIERAASGKDDLPFTSDQFAALIRSNDPVAMEQLAAGLAAKRPRRRRVDGI